MCDNLTYRYFGIKNIYPDVCNDIFVICIEYQNETFKYDIPLHMLSQSTEKIYLFIDECVQKSLQQNSPYIRNLKLEQLKNQK